MEVSENLSGISKPYKGSSREFHKISFSEPTIQNDPKWQWKKCKSRTVHWASCREFMLICTTQNLYQNKNYPIQSQSWQIWRKMSTFSASCRSLLFQAERLWPRISPLETWRIMPAEGQRIPFEALGLSRSMGPWAPEGRPNLRWQHHRHHNMGPGLETCHARHPTSSSQMQKTASSCEECLWVYQPWIGTRERKTKRCMIFTTAVRSMVN